MTIRPELNEAEWDLVIELLERERSELPVEIHHTRTDAVRHELHARLRLVQEMLDRLREPQTMVV